MDKDCSGAVLIVDDEPTMAAILQHALRRSGYQAQVVQSAAEALTTLDKEAWDLLVIDYGLPDMNGDHLAKVARARGYRGPIVMFTGNCFARKPEVVDMLVFKPVEWDVFRKVVASLLARTEADVSQEMARGSEVGEPVLGGTEAC